METETPLDYVRRIFVDAKKIGVPLPEFVAEPLKPVPYGCVLWRP